MTPTPNTTTTSPFVFPNPNFWSQMNSWVSTVARYVSLFYGLPTSVERVQGSCAPVVDPVTNSSEEDSFTLVFPLWNVSVPVVATQFAIFYQSIPAFAAALVTQAANLADVNPPGPLTAVAIPAPSAPPLPSNPIGPSYSQDGGVTTLYRDNGSPTIPGGGTYNNTDAAVAPVGTYTKHVKAWFMGVESWFTLNA